MGDLISKGVEKDKNLMFLKMRKLVIANWKMNPNTESEAERLVLDVQKEISLEERQKSEIVFCPPSIFIKSVAEKLEGGFFVGAQNVFYESLGTFTGEISADMIKSLNCKYCIVGHSERKKHFNETVDDIIAKILLLLKKDIYPVICVGEEKKLTKKLDGVEGQVNKILQAIPKTKISKLIFVYEPVWAISDGKKPSVILPSSDDVLSAKLLIQKCLVKKIGRNKISSVQILYGGSVNAENICKFVGDGLMDGALIGGASLKAKEFIKIIKQIN
ncbi:MAG: triose-phosphate isomerase [bacterium]